MGIIIIYLIFIHTYYSYVNNFCYIFQINNMALCKKTELNVGLFFTVIELYRYGVYFIFISRIIYRTYKHVIK